MTAALFLCAVSFYNAAMFANPAAAKGVKTPAAAARGGASPLAALPAAAAAVLFLALLLQHYNWQKAALAAVAMLAGAVFFYSQFGFSYTWRVFILRGDGRGLRAQMLWIALAAIPFAIITGATDWLDAQAAANVRPLSLGVAAGAFLFGVGMQSGGACTSGAMVNTGQGGGVALASLGAFVFGALFAASHIDFWTALPAIAPFSFYRQWGLGGAFVLVVLAAALAAATFLRRPRAPLPASPPGRLPLLPAAALLAGLSALLLLFGGQPWGIVYGFTLLGGKAAMALGAEDIAFWDFWATLPGGEEMLSGGVFLGSQTTALAGMLLGVAVAACAAGKFNWKPRMPSGKRLLLALGGGLLMGYGALISYGCNIGSYISALSSGSAHGWLWLLCAFAGAGAGVLLRRVAGLDR